MPVRRWLQVLVLPLAVGLTGCGGSGPLLPLRERPDPPPPPTQATSGKAKPTGQFASLPTVPGEVVRLNPGHPEPLPIPVEPPPPDPAVTVQPPPESLPPVEVPGLEYEQAAPLVRAFQAFHDNHPEEAVKHLEKFDKPNQELLLQLIPAVVQSSKLNLAAANADESAALARQFEAAATAVLKRTGFNVRKGVICLAVDGYGVYTPVTDPSALRRGALYSVYVELENVPCLPEVRSDGVKGFLTRLECEMRVTDEFGQAVEILDVRTKTPGPKSTSSKSEFTRSPLHDYFLTAVLQTPARPGGYTVTFEVRDPRTGRCVSKPIPFRVQ